jgi:formyl-CoA transferase
VSTVTDRSELPLDGIVVVALEQAVAAPIASRHLADLGAEVVKVERVGEGDFCRNYDDAVRGMASHFVWLNRGKRSIELDLKDPRGLEVLRRLVGRADVLVQNLAPGALERMGLDPDQLVAEQPRLIVASITGYGLAGPYADHKAYDMLIQAESGLVSVTGTPETATKTGIPTSDIAAGVYVAQGVLGALFRRERTGRGAVIDVAMLDATVEWLGHQVNMQMYAGRQVPRMGLSHAAIAPYDAYPTRDGEVLIGVQNDRGWAALTRDVLGRPDLADRPDLATNPLRVANRSETDRVVAEETRKWTTADLADRLNAAGVPAAQVNEMRGVVEHPQLEARGRWRPIGSPVGELSALLPPMTFRDVELPMGAVPALGEHTAAVLADLGYDEETIAALSRDGVIGTLPPGDTGSGAG